MMGHALAMSAASSGHVVYQSRALQAKVEAKHDPERLFKPTAASAMREAADKENERTPRDSGFIRHVAHKASTRLH
jgi:hypothetical protein